MSKKDDYMTQMQSRLKKWDAEIDALTAKANEIGAEARDKYYDQLKTMRANRETLAQKMQEFTSASEAAWQEMQKSMETAWDNMKAAMEKATSSFKK
jgi:phage host-nuclease inhibitor protein Gam